MRGLGRVKRPAHSPTAMAAKLGSPARYHRTAVGDQPHRTVTSTVSARNTDPAPPLIAPEFSPVKRPASQLRQRASAYRPSTPPLSSAIIGPAAHPLGRGECTVSVPFPSNLPSNFVTPTSGCSS